MALTITIEKDVRINEEIILEKGDKISILTEEKKDVEEKKESVSVIPEEVKQKIREKMKNKKKDK